MVKNLDMKKFLFVLQALLKFLLIFFAVFIWARYFIRQFWLSFVVALSLTFAIDFLTRFVGKKLNKRKELKVQEKEEAEDLFLSIATQEKSLDFYLKLAKSRYKNAKKKEGFVEIEHGENDKVILYPFLSFVPLNSNDLAKIISCVQKENCQKLVVVCGEIEKSTFSFAKNFEMKILLLDKFQTFISLYKEYDFYPEKTLVVKKDKKLAFKELVAFSFNRARAKGYIISALILFLSSLFIRPSVYYCIVASLLLVFALVSFVNPFYNVKVSNEVL